MVDTNPAVYHGHMQANDSRGVLPRHVTIMQCNLAKGRIADQTLVFGRPVTLQNRMSRLRCCLGAAVMWVRNHVLGLDGRAHWRNLANTMNRSVRWLCGLFLPFMQQLASINS